MDLKDIASISGKSGLFLVVKPTRSGVILETVDENKTKLIASATTRVSLLKEISIYTNGKESSSPLEVVFDKIYSQFKDNLPVSSKSSPEELNTFLEKVLPDFDKEKVYHSDIKKLVTWYQNVLQIFPERFQTESNSKTEEIKAENLMVGKTEEKPLVEENPKIEKTKKAKS